MAPLRVALVGATGETGTSIVNGLLEAGNFSIVALTRPSSVSKPANAALKERGVEIRTADLIGPETDLVVALKDIDIVISAVGPRDQTDQIPLATAATKAGVERFLPCGFITVAPPGGIMSLRDVKEQVNNHIKQICLPYTYVDVGWWYQIAYPRLPSGKIDYAAAPVISTMIKDGNVPSALTDLRDIGRYIARIIIDDRTINKYVLAYSELWTPNQVYDLLEKLSGEKLERVYTSEQQVRDNIKSAEAAIKEDPGNSQSQLLKITSEYQLSWGVRGDNTPEYAKYLGYLTSEELYPDMKYCKFEDYLQEVLNGKAKGVYKEQGTRLQQE